MARSTEVERQEQRRLGGELNTLLWRFAQQPAHRPDREEAAENLRRKGAPDSVVDQVLEVADRVAAAAPEHGFGDTKAALRIAAEEADRLGVAWFGEQSDPAERSREDLYAAVVGRPRLAPEGEQVTVRASARGNPVAGRPRRVLPARQ